MASRGAGKFAWRIFRQGLPRISCPGEGHPWHPPSNRETARPPEGIGAL